MKHVEEIELDGKRLTFEAGQLARQAHGAMVVRHEGSMLLATVVSAPGLEGVGDDARSQPDFVPLTVEYRERMSASGRIPGGYGRRETRIADHEVLTSRLIDRSLRPLFPKGFTADVQVLVTVYGADAKSDLESLALIAAAGAMHLSPLPLAPVAGLRVARVPATKSAPERVALLPSEAERDLAHEEWVVAASRGDDGAMGLVMIEGAASEVGDARVVETLAAAMGALGPVLDAFERLRAGLAREHGQPLDRAVSRGDKHGAPPAPGAAIAAAVAQRFAGRLAEAYADTKIERRAAVTAICREAVAALPEHGAGEVTGAVHAAWRELVRTKTAAGERLGGRGLDVLRDIASEVGILPTNHGSALFTRGETQALVSVTLGPSDESLVYETVLGRKNERFYLHYNFPPFSVGEVKPSRGPGRREIGHGALARAALAAVMPAQEDLAFSVRVVSDILESNGSSSMATVCGASLALMDAGVAITAPVAGIAMGLVMHEGRAAILSDITGDEDGLGDMDFKVAATRAGITALQLDNKLGAVPLALLGEALAQARRGIEAILDALATTLAAPRPLPPAHAPQIAQIRIRPSRVGTLIGPGGKTIQELQSATGTRIDVKDDGRVRITARRASDLKNVLARIEQLTLELEVGKVYPAEVVTLKEYGAFVRIGDHEGLVHISELAPTRVDKVEDVLELGAIVDVKVIGADKRGRLELSRKAAL